jgi:hypothetical protein
MNADRQPHQPAPTAGPPPRIILDERYPPRICAAPNCPIPPHVRWRITVGGVLYGLYRRIGEPIDLCDTHEREVVYVTGSFPRPPRQRDESA